MISLKITRSGDAQRPQRADLDLYLRSAGDTLLARSIRANGVGGTEEITRLLQPGRYVVEVRAHLRNMAEYELTVIRQVP